jgi:hypothetical protein
LLRADNRTAERFAVRFIDGTAGFIDGPQVDPKPENRDRDNYNIDPGGDGASGRTRKAGKKIRCKHDQRLDDFARR